MQTLTISASELRYFQQLDERQRRLYAAVKATELGWTGVSQVCQAYGLNRKTVYRGKEELASASFGVQQGIRSSLGKKKATRVTSFFGQN